MSLWTENLQHLEERMARMEKRQDTMYQRSYARLERRGKADREALEQSRRWAKAFKDLPGVPAQRLGRILAQVERGKVIVALDRRAYHQLQKLLARTRYLPSRKPEARR